MCLESFLNNFSLDDSVQPKQNSPGYVVEISFLNELPTIKVMAQYCECNKAEDGARDQSHSECNEVLSRFKGT